LPKVVTQQCPTASRTHDLFDRKSQLDELQLRHLTVTLAPSLIKRQMKK